MEKFLRSDSNSPQRCFGNGEIRWFEKELLEHLCYSPNSASSDCHLSSKLLAGKRFGSNEEIIIAEEFGYFAVSIDSFKRSPKNDKTIIG